MLLCTRNEEELLMDQIDAAADDAEAEAAQADGQNPLTGSAEAEG